MDNFGFRRRFTANFDWTTTAIDNVGVFCNEISNEAGQMEEIAADDPGSTIHVSDPVESQARAKHEMEVDNDMSDPSRGEPGRQGVKTKCQSWMSSESSAFPTDQYKGMDAFVEHLNHCIGDFTPGTLSHASMAIKANREILQYINRLSAVEHKVDTVFRSISVGIDHLTALEQKIVSAGIQPGSGEGSGPTFLPGVSGDLQPLVPLLLAKAYADLANYLEEPEDDSEVAGGSFKHESVHQLTTVIHDALVRAALVVLRHLDDNFPAKALEKPDPAALEEIHEEYMAMLSLFTSFEHVPSFVDLKPAPKVAPLPEEAGGVSGVLSYITDSLATFSLFSGSGADDSVDTGEEEAEAEAPNRACFLEHLSSVSHYYVRFAVNENTQLYTELVKDPPSTAVGEIAKHTLNFILEKIGFETHVAREHMSIVGHLRNKIGNPLESVIEPLECIYDRYKELTEQGILEQWADDLRNFGLASSAK